MITVNTDLCVGCGACQRDCITGYLSILEPAHKAAVTGDRCIRCGHCEAICPVAAVELTGGGYTEYSGFDIENAHADADELESFMAFRRSIRHFKSKPVEPEKLERLIEAGRFSPTGSNAQTLGFIVLEKTIEDVKKKASACLTDELMDKLSPRVNRGTLEKIVKAQGEGADRLFFGAPVVILITDSRGVGIDAGLAASRIELLANALGLGVCINGILPMVAANSEELAESIGLEKGRHVAVSLAIGYPAISFMRPPKRKKANVRWQ